MKNVAIIQARLGSSRFPGKMLHDLMGKPILDWAVHRASQARTIHRVVIATTDSPKDLPLVEHCQKSGWDCYTGSEQDVLDRYYQAALHYQADRIVRITGDCPLVDPALIDQALALLEMDPAVQYASNVQPITFPEGQSVEAFPFASLKLAWEKATQPSFREHVTPYLRFNDSFIRHASFHAPAEMANLRMTVDYPEDAQLLTLLLEELKKTPYWPDFTWKQAADVMLKDERMMKLVNMHERDRWRKTVLAEHQNKP